MFLDRFRGALHRVFLRNGANLPSPDRIGRDHVIWAYRLFLDREPESEGAIRLKLAGHGSAADLRRDFLTSAEFSKRNGPDLAYSASRCVVIKEIDADLRLFVDLSDVAIGLNIVRDRYEVDESRFIEATVRPGDTVLDIGANVGFHTIRMASRVGSTGCVYAFEPVVQNLELLDRSIRENGFEGRVVVVRQAVGEASGEAEMVFLSLDERAFNSGGASLRAPDGKLLPGHQVIRVPVLALDNYPLRRPIRFIKIDIEGAEPLAMRGARELLRSDRPPILSEIHPVQLLELTGRTAADFIAEMASVGYRCHLLEDGRVGRAISGATDDRIRSVVFLPM